MGNFKGVLAGAVGGLGGGMVDIGKQQAAFRMEKLQADALTERETHMANLKSTLRKQEADEGLIRSKELATHTAGVGLEAAKKERGAIAEEAMDVEWAKLNEMVDIPEEEKQEYQKMVKAGFKIPEIIGKKGTPPTSNDVLNYQKAATQELGEDADPETKRALVEDYIKRFHGSSLGLKDIRENKKITDADNARVAEMQRLVDNTKTGILDLLNTDKTKAFDAFGKAAAARPDVALATVAQMEAEKQIDGATARKLRKIMAGDTDTGVIKGVPQGAAGGGGALVGATVRGFVDLPKNMLYWNNVTGEWMVSKAIEFGKGLAAGFKQEGS